MVFLLVPMTMKSRVRAIRVSEGEQLLQNVSAERPSLRFGRLTMIMWKAKRSAIGAESSEKSHFVSNDLGLLGLCDELDHVALLGDAVFIDERIKKAGMNTEIWSCSNVFVRDVRRVEHQVRHGHGMNFHVRRPHRAHDRRDHV